jgi:hypothetical protein
MLVLIMSMFMVVQMFMIVVIMMPFVVVMLRIGMVMFGIVQMRITGLRVQAFRVFVTVLRPSDLRRLGACDHPALDTLAMAAAARVAMTWTAPVGAVFGLFLCLTMGTFVRFDQRLTVGNRNLIVIGVDFAEGQKAVAIAAILDKGGLERRLYASDFGEIDVAAQLLALGGLEIKFFDAVAADHNDPGLFRVGSVYQHFVGHLGTLDGGGRVEP